jgi:aspartyl-tRNA(Asn)/glutamyl-tRNA(Gln) amidotransferase subunit A
MCLVSLGSDTGGSVRQPASFCGIYGLKPTYSRISRWGLIAYASSFDCIGIFARSTEDLAITLEVIAGNDDKDSTVSRKPVPAYSSIISSLTSPKKYKIAYLKDALTSQGIDADVRDNFAQQVEKLKLQGHQLGEVELKLQEYALPTYYILTTAEASSNLSRYDGVRYGYRSSATTDLMSMFKKSRSEGFGKEVKKRIMLGTFVLSANYYDAYFTKAQRVRRLIKQEFESIFAEYDLLIMPSSPITAWERGKFNDDPLAMYLADIFTVTANLAGIPGISIPVGVDRQQLPIGLQVLSKDFNEEVLLSFSKFYVN